MRSVSLPVASFLIAAACAAPAAPSDPLAGIYRIGGGDAPLANVQALTDAFVAKHPGVKFQFETSFGSDGGINLAADRTLDLGMASRELTDAENALVDHVLVGVAGTGLVVHRANSVQDLATAQLLGIYTTKLTDWSALGGVKLPIVPLVREKGSSARTTFESYVFGGKAAYGLNVLEIQGGDQMRQGVAGQPGAIGMVGVTDNVVDATGIHLVTIDGVAPTRQALRDGSYRLRRPLYLVFSRAGALRPAISLFIEFVRGPEGQRIVERF